MYRKVIHAEQAPAPIGAYSQAVEAQGTLYVSGQIALKNGILVNTTIQEETHQVMQNIEAILAEADMGWHNVVKCSIFVKDLSNFTAINEVYGSYFKGIAYPARETVEVSRLPKDVGVEISCIAIK